MANSEVQTPFFGGLNDALESVGRFRLRKICKIGSVTWFQPLVLKTSSPFQPLVHFLSMFGYLSTKFLYAVKDENKMHCIIHAVSEILCNTFCVDLY